jgi:SAM-dependent methyltransferase
VTEGGVFDLYAAYYDLLYRDKDYAAEAAYVARLLREATPQAGRLLELGCGTGGHAFELAKLGFEVDGIDLSEAMVARAQARREASPELVSRLVFQRGDVRSHRDGRRYDGVISLFHVMSYQVSNEDLSSAFVTARAHLAPGGAFLFDSWWGPAVLSDRPHRVTKQVADDRIEVLRQTTPMMRLQENVVDVQFDVGIRARDGRHEQVQELHRMRYLFGPELRLMLADAGFELQRAEAWMTGTELDDRSWYACFVARAV